jgi:hypothetical protein
VILVLAILSAAALFIAREWRIAGVWGFPLDDSWIHAQIARNIANGQGFSFNPGERVAGSTGPLYTILLALLYRVTGEFVWTAKILGLLCHVASSILILLAMLEWDPRGKVKAFLAAFLVAWSPPLLWASLSGMEISLYLLLVCAGIYFYSRGKPVLTTLAWALGVWVRPDGLFLVGLGLVLIRKDVLRSAVAAIAVILPFFLFNMAVGGTLFPQTVGAKAHFGFEPVTRTWNLLREWGAIWGIPYRKADEMEHPALLLIGLIAGAWALRRKHPLLAIYAIGLPVALSLFREQSGSGKRYILYVIPFGAILAAHGFEYLSRKLLHTRAIQGLILASVVTMAWQAAYLVHKATVYGWNVQNIDKMQGYLGRLSRFLTKPGDRIATNDIGAIGYLSDRPVIDLMGLVTPLMPLPQALSRYRPELLIIFVDWFKDYAEYDAEHDTFNFFDADSTHQYTVVAGVELIHNTISAKDQMLLFKRYPRGAPLPQKRLLRRF